MSRLLMIALVATRTVWAAEPAAHRLTAMPLEIASPLTHVSAATELPNGRLMVTDQDTPAVWIIDPATGIAKSWGAPGAGPTQYAQPGGFYSGAAGATLLLDRSQSHVLVISPAGAFVRGYSIAVKGTSGSSSADIDRQQLDAKDLAYFVDRQIISFARPSGAKANTVDLVRFDAAAQKRDVVTKLLVPEEKQTSSSGNVVMSRAIVGSPADGWGVTPDGRVAVVRAVPYHVEWIAPSGKITAGPVIDYDVLPMTDADKRAAAAAASSAGTVSSGALGGAQVSSSDTTGLYAAMKPPFKADDVIVSPASRVWVMRTGVLGAPSVVYDVFDSTGARVARVEFPSGSRVVGFGKGSVLVREGSATLKRYKVS